jgi:hypothetical protein
MFARAHSLREFRNRAHLALGIVLLATVTVPSAAQQVNGSLSAQQCSDALSIAHQLVARNAGKISSDLRDSFARFGKSNCALETDWKTTGKQDEEIFGEFRLRLIAMRTANAAKAPTPARTNVRAKD